MSTSNGSFLERFIRVFTRGAIPIDASQCDGPCVVHSPAPRPSRSRTAKTTGKSRIAG